MKHYNLTSADTPINLKEDIQIQVPTARLGIRVRVDSDIELKDIYVRSRIVSGTGTETNIEKMSLRDLFQISGSTPEGFYRRGVVPGENGGGSTTVYSGSILLAKNGALDLSTARSLSVDLGLYDQNHRFVSAQINSIQAAKVVSEYIHYNPVTIQQQIQNIPLDRADAVVLPIQNVSKVQISYPGQTCDYTKDELGFIGDMSNDIVAVSNEGVILAGYEDLVVLPTRDLLSGLTATRLQVERGDYAPAQFNVFLLETKSL